MNNPSEKLNYSANGEFIKIEIPISAPNPNNSVIVVEFEGIPTSFEKQ
jgi:hypothetical protein